MRERSTAPLLGRGRGVAGRAAAAALLSVVALLGAGATSASAGPGVVMKSQSGDPQIVSGAAIAQNADSGGTYTLREQPDDPPRSISLRGLSIRGLLTLAGFNAAAVTHVSVVGGDGPLITLTGPEINNPPFPEGPALVSDVGGETRFIKPARSSGATSSYVTSVPGTPLEIQVGGGGLLGIEATATPKSAKTGQKITFKARVKFATAPGYTYMWNFDDDSAPASGGQTTHEYTSGGDYEVSVTVSGVGGPDCTPSCGGVGKVRVQVSGQTRRPEDAQGTPLGGGPGGTGTGGTGTGAGSGNGTGGSGSSGTSKGSRKAPPLRAERPEAHSRFSSNPQSGAGKTIVQGILLAGQGSAIEGTLPGGSPSGSPKPRKGVPGRVDNPSNVAASILLALLVVALGALRERRHVRLRLA